MKLAVAVCIAFAAVLVYSERCVGPSDCQLVSCANNSRVICERQECTCSEPQRQCSGRSDCPTSRCPSRFDSWHCVDGVCRCLNI